MASQLAAALPRRATRIPAEVAGVVAILLGGAVIYGWVDRRLDLVQLRTGQVPMQFNAALCLTLLGLALLLVLSRWFRFAVLPLAVATAYGIGTFAQYATGRALGIDTLLFRPWLTTGTESPGRMARNTAICVALLGVTALWLVLSGRKPGAASLAVGAAGSFVAAVSMVALFGYAGNVTTAYTWRTSTAMAPTTAVGLLLLAVGYISAGWGAATASGAPRWLPVPVGVCALATTLFLWQSLVNLGDADARAVSLDRAAGAVLAIGMVFSALLAAATALGQDARRRRSVAEGLAAKLEQEAARRIQFQDTLVRRAARDGLLRTAYGAVSQATSLEEGFEAFAGAAAEVLAFDRASLSLVDDDVARVVAVSGSMASSLPIGTEVPTDDPLVARVLTSREPDLETDVMRTFGETRSVLHGIGSFVAAPVIVGGEPRAVLRFATARAGAFVPDDRVFVGELINVVGGALYTLAKLQDEQRTTARLRELDQLKNEFVGVVAHDLRSPMTVIAGYVDTVLLHWTDLPDDTKRELLGVASKNTKRLSVLVEDVLQVARIESGDFPYEIAPFDLGALVRRTVQEMNAARPDRPVTVDAPESLPTALGDEDRQWRVLTNLVSNAQKFSPPDQPVVVGVREVGDLLEVSVADRGPGIPEEDQSRLFGKFSRLSSAPGGEKGTGLGLYICKALVEAQGGTITVESRLGDGTTLRYTVPRTRGSA